MQRITAVFRLYFFAPDPQETDASRVSYFLTDGNRRDTHGEERTGAAVFPAAGGGGSGMAGAGDCRRVLLATSEQLQSIVDRPDLAAWYGPYILDHAGQGFRGLWNIAPGDTVTVAARPYRCRFVTTGWSDCGIRPKSGPLPAAALYLCTCVPGGREYEIYIVGLEPV